MRINIKYVPVIILLAFVMCPLFLGLTYKHRYDENKIIESEIHIDRLNERNEVNVKSQKDILQEVDSVKISVPIDNCGCVRNISAPKYPKPELKSSCSDLSTSRGENQKVYATSLFGGGVQSTYAKGFFENVKLIPKYFPGWIYRVYSDWDFSNPAIKNKVCPLLCSTDFVDWCDIHKSPSMGNMDDYAEGTVWRFAPLADNTVHIYAIRDVDSYPSEREKAAVQEWELSGKAYHVMRDHPYHDNKILAGMWGGRKHSRDQEHNKILWEYIKKHRSSTDQQILGRVLWVEMQYSLYSHDSYFCTKFSHTHPWPLQRLSPKDFVGNPVFRPVFDIEPHQTCPMECRPKDHQDWDYC